VPAPAAMAASSAPAAAPACCIFRGFAHCRVPSFFCTAAASGSGKHGRDAGRGGHALVQTQRQVGAGDRPQLPRIRSHAPGSHLRCAAALPTGPWSGCSVLTGLFCTPTRRPGRRLRTRLALVLRRRWRFRREIWSWARKSVSLPWCTCSAAAHCARWCPFRMLACAPLSALTSRVLAGKGTFGSINR
jgi:hypothetical protein